MCTTIAGETIAAFMEQNRFFQRNVYTVQARYWQKCRNQFSKHAMKLEIQSRQCVTAKIEGFANLCHIDHDSAFLHLQNIFSFARIRHGSRFFPTIIVAWQTTIGSQRSFNNNILFSLNYVWKFFYGIFITTEKCWLCPNQQCNCLQCCF